MKQLSWRAFDALLRGQLTAEERIRLIGAWTVWQILGAAVFGASLGVYSVTGRDVPDVRFLLAGALKMPLLLLLTSAVTLPSLYVFGTLRGLRFYAREFVAILMVAHTVFAAVLASLAPVIAFFALTTSSYSFMVMLTVFACIMGGSVGVRVFLRALNDPDPSAGPLPPEASRTRDVPGGAVALVPEVGEGEPLPVAPTPPPVVRPTKVSEGAWQLLGWWIFLYMFVGTQSGWILRPFIGHPDKSFVLFRGKTGGFIEGTLHHLWEVLTGG
jgi:hypothetical protein